jgi:hypothetical protein
MLPAVLVGALLSAAVTLPLALPFGPRAHDLGLLGLLGVVQLAIPCLMAMGVARVLRRPRSRCWPCWRWCSACCGPGWVPARRPACRCWAAARWCWARWSSTKAGLRQAQQQRLA